MKVLQAANVNTAYPKGIMLLKDYGVLRPSRAGNVLVMPEPVTTHYNFPRERVLFSPQRDANPFFHLFEALWMLTGADDVAMPKYFVRRMETFSDNGETYHGAYGYRWRHAPDSTDPGGKGYDQLLTIIDMLRKNTSDRRVILQIWDHDKDLATQSLDIPCNVMVKFEISPGYHSGDLGSRVENGPQLNMVVFNRSNDIVWGAYGANAVQFSMLQEYIAAHIGVPVGWYEQVSTNFHAYENVWDKYCPLTDPFPFHNPYDGRDQIVQVETLVTDVNSFDSECKQLIDHARKGTHTIGDFVTEGYRNRFFHTVCNPMLWAYAYYRQGHVKEAIQTMEKAILESREIDWLVAGERWLRRVSAQRMMANTMRRDMEDELEGKR